MQLEKETAVLAKVEYEWEQYLLELQRGSKQTILAKADEISRKKYLLFLIKLSLGYFEQSELERLHAENHLLETVSRHLPEDRQDIVEDLNVMTACLKQIAHPKLSHRLVK